MSNYRQRVYEKYATVFKDSSDTFDAAMARRLGRAYHHYLRGWLPEDKSAAIVDLGCGNGWLLHHFKELGYTNLTGVDLSPEQVKLARQVTPNVREQNVFDFLRDDPHRYDFLISLDLVEHLNKDELLTFLELARQRLKPGGRLVLQTPNAASPMFDIIRYGDYTHEQAFSPDLLSRLLRLCGFEKPQPREQGPVPGGYSFKSSVRALLWKICRWKLMLWNLAEIGACGGKVWTRVFLISAVTPK